MNRPKRNQRITSRRDESSPQHVAGSDKRVAGGITGSCRLCDRPSQLQLSHVAPKWMYKWAKAEGGLLGEYNSLGVRTFGQDGLKIYLLCADCEQFLGRAERYAALFMGADSIVWESLGITAESDALFGVDHTMLQRFVFGVILKAHWAMEPPYHETELRAEDEERLKDYVLSGGSAEIEYPMLCQRILSEKNPAVDPRAMLFIGIHYDGELPGAYVIGAGWEIGFFFNQTGWVDTTIFSDLRMRYGMPMWCGYLDIMEHRIVTRGAFHRW